MSIMAVSLVYRLTDYSMRDAICQLSGNLFQLPQRNKRFPFRLPVADRIITFAEVVGQEDVMAGTDCGLGGRVHPQIAWTKLRALRDGAAIASKNFLRRISKILCGDERNEEAAFWAQNAPLT
jgi:hypothetical protein